MHISLPEAVYRELKRTASDMGIQVTDLIKMFIRMGLNGDLIASRSVVANESRLAGKDVEYLKGKVFIMENMLRSIQEKIEELERRIEELESPDIVFNTRKFGSGRINKP